MRLRRHLKMSREGWYFLALVGLVLAGAVIRGVNLLLVLGGMLLGPFLLSRPLAAMTLRGLTVRRKLPQGICAGDLLVAQITITNTKSHLGAWAVVAEEEIERLAADGAAAPSNGLAAGLGVTAKTIFDTVWRSLALMPPPASSPNPRVFFPYLPATQSRKGVYRGRLTERGRYRLGPLQLSTRFPFGLFRGSMTFGQKSTLVVYPRLGQLSRGWLARHHESFAGTDRRERRPGPEGDFFGVRPWRSGDSRRWIHWRTSARAGKLVVRQYEQPRNRDVALLLDVWPAEQSDARHRASVELAVSFAATVVADLCRKGGSNVYLGTINSQPEYGGGPASAALLQDLMERLAIVEVPASDSLPELLAEATGRIDPGMEIVLISTRAVDLGDAARLGPLASDAAARAVLRQIRVVDASSEELGHYFRAE
jgi:uncharacterized protein (DUF58 family)